MSRAAGLGCAAALLLSAGGLALPQSSNLPVPSGSQSASVPHPPATHFKTSQYAPDRALVVYAQGQLEITANRSSLHQILLEVGRQTGMKITGGVGEERVFGQYGPSKPANVLSSLLYGTDSNMLLKENASGAPEELILTPREAEPGLPAPAAPVASVPFAPPVTRSAPVTRATLGRDAMPAGSSAAGASDSSPAGGVGSSPAGVTSTSGMTSAQRVQFIQQLQQQQQLTRQH